MILSMAIFHPVRMFSFSLGPIYTGTQCDSRTKWGEAERLM
jgi:hypothetical protein